MFYKKGVLKNFEKLTEKHQCWSFFFNKVTGPRPVFIDFYAGVFFSGLQKFLEHLFWNHLWSKTEKVNITIEYYIFKLVSVTTFSLNWKFWFFGPSLIKKDISGQKKVKLNITIEFCIFELQSWTKYLETFSLFSTNFLHHKWNGTKLLSPESKCASSLTSCQTT